MIFKGLFEVACVANVSVGLGSKESQRNGIFGVLPARKMVREPKRGKRGRRGEGSFVPLPHPPLSFYTVYGIFLPPQATLQRLYVEGHHDIIV